METTPGGWIVLDRDSGVLCRHYNFKDAPGGTCTTFAARLPDGTMAVVSPSRETPDEAFTELVGFGEVSAIVANNGFHHLGQVEWRARFPEAVNYAAPLTAARIAKKNKAVPQDFRPLAELQPKLGDSLVLREADDTKTGETWGWAKTGSGTVFYASDVLCNWDAFPGNFLLSSLWKWTKSGPGPSVFHLALTGIAKDKKALLGRFHDDLKAADPSVIVPSHGGLLVESSDREAVAGKVAAALA